MNLLMDYEGQDQWRDWDTMLERLPITMGQRVLDLGCGPGLVSRRLAARGANVVGVDKNEAFVRAARQRCPANCMFLETDLATLDIRHTPQADGLWSSYASAYFPDFAPILKRWISCLSPGGWVALVEIDDLWRGHHPLPTDVRATLKECSEQMRGEGNYDCRKGRRLRSICRDVGLTNISESRWNDAELAFEGPASPEIVAAWQRRFARAPMMKAYLGARSFNEITKSFLEAITSPDHRSTAAVVMVQAERPL